MKKKYKIEAAYSMTYDTNVFYLIAPNGKRIGEIYNGKSADKILSKLNNE